MLRHPDVQAKAQRELDAVVGHGNLPGFEHEGALPYVGAVIKEVVRTAPILPLCECSGFCFDTLALGCEGFWDMELTLRVAM